MPEQRYFGVWRAVLSEAMIMIVISDELGPFVTSTGLAGETPSMTPSSRIGMAEHVTAVGGGGGGRAAARA